MLSIKLGCLPLSLSLPSLLYLKSWHVEASVRENIEFCNETIDKYFFFSTADAAVEKTIGLNRLISG